MNVSLTKLRMIVAPVIVALLFAANAHATNPPSTRVNNKMIIGDSIFALTGDIHEHLEADLNEVIDTYARSGCQMNGGGNDFLLGNGCGATVTLSSCMETLLAIEETIANLTNQMKADGIRKIVFLGYYAAPGAPELKIVNDYSMDLKASIYPSMGITFVETRYAFAGNESRYVSSDGIHPSAAGSRVLADLIRAAL